MEISEALSRFVASPRRWLIVIIGSLVIGLVTVLPLVDEYKGLNDHREELTAELTRARAEAETLPRFEKRVDSRRIELASYEAKAVPTAKVHAFRNEVVDLVRESGCQVRRINAGEPRSRIWLKDDSPLEMKNRPKKIEESRYLLDSQTFGLTVTGTMPQLTDLLSRLYAQQKVMHTSGLSVRPASRSSVELELQLELVLFDLTQKELPKAI